MKLRVAYVLESLDYTGAGRQVVALAKGLPREEFEAAVAGLNGWGPLGGELSAAGIPTLALHRRRGWEAIALWRLRSWLATFQPQIVHAWRFAASRFARWAAGRDRRLVVTQRPAAVSQGWRENVIAEWPLSRTDCLVASCQTASDAYLLRHGHADGRRLTVIQPGVAPPATGGSRIAFLEEIGLPHDATLIGAVGKLTREQCLADMLWAVEILGALYPQLHLLLIGDGPERRSLERLAGCLRRTHLIHFLGHRDAALIIPNVDLLWHTGAEDDLPSAVLEAMAAGLPAVACDTPALRELIIPGESGLLFPVGDRPGLARCTQKVLQDSALRKRLGDTARRHIAAHFSVQAMVDRHVELYRATVSGTPRTQSGV